MWKKVRIWHWWLSLIIGIQVLIWSLSGAYMVLTDIQFIRGQHLVKSIPSVKPTPHINYGFRQVLADYPSATNLQLNLSVQTPYIQFNNEQQIMKVSIVDGKNLPALTVAEISNQARAHYSGNASIENVQLLEQAPSEISARHAPVWQVEFNDTAHTTFYYREATNTLVSKRHDYWRIFDFLWRLHIMDYWQGVDIHTPWLTAVSISSSLMALLGLFLIYPWLRHTFFTNRKSRRSDNVA